MPDVILVAGPNGAGKTTFINHLLIPRTGQGPEMTKLFQYINADEIASIIAREEGEYLSRYQAARRMIEITEVAILAGDHVIIETTLASLRYVRLIPKWQETGYAVTLMYLGLPSVECSIERVRERVRRGGHEIPENVIRRRFPKSLEYLETRYKPIVDDWLVYDSVDGDFKRVDQKP